MTAAQNLKDPPNATPSAPADGSRWWRTADMDWRTRSAQVDVKQLFVDEKGGQSSALMRIAPKSVFAPHRHAGIEELFILEGTFCDDGVTYGPGSYAIRSRGVEHTGSTETGCVMLVLYRP